MNLSEIIGVFFIVLSILFFVTGIIGLIRFPDVYTRIHASGKVSMVGVVGLLVATAFLMPDTTLKVIALGAFLIITQPVASHTIASAAYRSGVNLHNVKQNDLAEKLDIDLTDDEMQKLAERTSKYLGS